MSMFTEIINPFLNVRNKVKNRSGQWVDQQPPNEEIVARESHGTSVDGNTEIVVFDVSNKKVIIDSLVIYTDAQLSAHLLVSPKGSGGTINIFRVVGINSIGFLTPNRIHSYARGHHEYFDLVNYDEDTERGLMMLKKEVTLPTGGRLTLQGNSPNEGTVTYKVVWREIEE